MKTNHYIGLIILLLFIAGCQNHNSSKSLNQRRYAQVEEEAGRYKQKFDSVNRALNHTKKRHKAKYQFIEQKVELISAIQQKLNSIEIQGERLNRNFSELKKSNIQHDEQILKKIDFLKDQLRNTYDIIEKLKSRDQSGKIAEFKGTIKRLNHALKLKEENIDSLEKKIKAYIDKVHHQKQQISTQKKTIRELKEEKEELDKKRLFMFSKVDFRREVLKKNRIHLPYPARNIKILSSHPREAYRIRTLKKGLFVKNKNEMVITNWSKFFSRTNFLIIQIDERRL